jgi:hypothetical protein
VLEAGVYRGLARYAWLRMVRNQVEVCAEAPGTGLWLLQKSHTVKLSCLRTFLSPISRMIVGLFKHKHRPA